MKGLKFDFVSSNVLEDKPKDKRISFILNKVKDGTILVTDAVMNPNDEMDLIKETMRRVDSGFPGIEVASLKKQTKGMISLVERMSDQKDRIQNLISGITGNVPEKSGMKTGLTFIGPSRYIKKIKKNPNSFSILAEV
jgi:hypothetical protein